MPFVCLCVDLVLGHRSCPDVRRATIARYLILLLLSLLVIVVGVVEVDGVGIMDIGTRFDNVIF